MTLSNQNDTVFMKSSASRFIDKSNMEWSIKIPLIKIYTKRSSFESKVKYYKKVRDAIAESNESKQYSIHIFIK